MALVRPLPARHLRSLVAFGSHEPERGCPFGRWSHARLQRRSPPMARLGPNSLNGWRQSSSGSSSRPSMRPAQRSSCSLELKSTSSIASADDDSSRTSSSTSAPERGGPGSGGARLASAEASVDDSSLPLMSAPMRSAASAAGPPPTRLASAGCAAGPPRRTSVELPRFRGHLTIGGGGPHEGSPDATHTTALPARVPPRGDQAHALDREDGGRAL